MDVRVSPFGGPAAGLPPALADLLALGPLPGVLPVAGEDERVDPATAERLRALGYGR